MAPTSKHLSDAEQIALLDGEHPPSVAHLTHLAVCWECRDRQNQFRASSQTIRDLYRSAADLPNVRELPDAGEARAQLQRNLRAAAISRPPLPRWSYAAAATLLFGAGLLGFLHRAHSIVQAAEIIPNVHLTPGATHPVQLADLCTAPDADQDPAVTPELRDAVLAEYGLNIAHAADYQIDYLINPQLGGTADVANLWPEPYRADSWNARAKDALEAHLHTMVCTRQIDLATAQREIATNWIEAYKKYLRTTRPSSS